MFADDTNVFVHGKSLDEVIAKANKSLASLSKWFTANKLSLSVDKTSYSVFGKPDDKNITSLSSCVIMTLNRLAAVNTWALIHKYYKQFTFHLSIHIYCTALRFMQILKSPF